MKGKKLLVLSLTTVLLAGCGDTVAELKPVDGGTAAKDAVAHASYDSVYKKIGDKVSINDVVEDAKGLASVTVDGKKYDLGMDFLSMAMVYNCAVPASGAYANKTETDIYNQWWKLYIQRWNYLVPEVPLYSNQYFDLYNKKLSGFETSPYWGAIDAINKTSSTDGKVILGSGTELSGAFRAPSWGKSSPAASDNDVNSICTGYSTVMSDMSGALRFNLYDANEGYGVLDGEPTKVINEDGTLTYTMKIKEGLKFSDDTEVKAANYLVGFVVNSTAVGKEAGGTGNGGLNIVGYKDFAAATDKSVKFKGVKLLGDYEFSVTYEAKYANYYYAISYAGFSPNPLALYLGSATDALKADETTKEVYLDDEFWAKGSDGKYTHAAEIKANIDNPVGNIPYSGPFKVSQWDKATSTAKLVRNDKYPGDAFRGKAPATNPINEIAYIKTEDETQMAKFEAGEVDVIAGITGGDETEKALKLTKGENAIAKETHYDRAGYGKLAFRCDFGPGNFASVRQAVMYTLNRPEFAQSFTGGYGSVVDGPYYPKSATYLAVKDSIKLNKYSYSAAEAIKVLEADGWKYNADGSDYDADKGGIRYKKLSGYEKSLNNLTYATVDNKYFTVKNGDDYYMPLAINWYGTQPNPVTDKLITLWQKTPTATTAIGAYIQYISSDFLTAVYGEYCLIPDYGFNGSQKCVCVNFATSFGSAVYDFAYNWTIDQDMYGDYSNNYLMDEADFFENY